MNVLSWLDFSDGAWTWRHYLTVSALALAVGAGVICRAMRQGTAEARAARRWRAFKRNRRPINTVSSAGLTMQHDGPDSQKRSLFSRASIVLIGFLVVGAFYLITERPAHFWLTPPWLLLN
jgi:hypothetical protein